MTGVMILWRQMACWTNIHIAHSKTWHKIITGNFHYKVDTLRSYSRRANDTGDVRSTQENDLGQLTKQHAHVGDRRRINRNGAFAGENTVHIGCLRAEVLRKPSGAGRISASRIFQAGAALRGQSPKEDNARSVDVRRASERLYAGRLNQTNTMSFDATP